jgi:hypothetical protein
MALSDLIQGEFDALRDLPQRPDFHPEKYVFDHEAMVAHSLRQMTENGSREQRELLLVAAFHDIGKIPTTDRKANGGYITSYGHAEKSRKYWDAVAPAFEGLDVRTDVVGWLIEEHMNLKFSDRMKDRKLQKKKQKAQSLGQRVWTMGQFFKQADDMLAFFENHGLDYREDADASDDHLEPLDRHEEAIGRFEDVISGIIDHIRSFEESSGGNKELILLRGVPGCGKTTFAESIRSRHGEMIATDEFFETDGGYDFDPSKLGEAHEWCRSETEKMMESGTPQVIVHNTFTQVWEMIAYYSMAAKYGYRVHSIVVENRHGGESEHGVPESACNKMENRFEVRLQ